MGRRRIRRSGPDPRNLYLPLFGSASAVYQTAFSFPFFSSSRWGYAAYTTRQEPDALFWSILRYVAQPYSRLLPYQPVLESAGDVFNGLSTQSYSTCDFMKDPS